MKDVERRWERTADGRITEPEGSYFLPPNTPRVSVRGDRVYLDNKPLNSGQARWLGLRLLEAVMLLELGPSLFQVPPAAEQPTSPDEHIGLPVPVRQDGRWCLPDHQPHNTPERIRCWIGERDPHQFQELTSDKRVHPESKKHPDRCAFCGTGQDNPRHHGQRDGVE